MSEGTQDKVTMTQGFVSIQSGPDGLDGVHMVKLTSITRVHALEVAESRVLLSLYSDCQEQAKAYCTKDDLVKFTAAWLKAHAN